MGIDQRRAIAHRQKTQIQRISPPQYLQSYAAHKNFLRTNQAETWLVRACRAVRPGPLKPLSMSRRRRQPSSEAFVTGIPTTPPTRPVSLLWSYKQSESK